MIRTLAFCAVVALVPSAVFAAGAGIEGPATTVTAATAAAGAVKAGVDSKAETVVKTEAGMKGETPKPEIATKPVKGGETVPVEAKTEAVK